MNNLLYIDIETAPAKVYTWGLWNQNITIEKIIEPPRILCFAWQMNDGPIEWINAQHRGTAAYAVMINKAAELLDTADIVVHFNGRSFDVPWLQGEIAQARLTPPSPFKQVDLKVFASKYMMLPSNKLDYIAPLFVGKGKTKHAGFQLWADVMDGNAEAWDKMREYNLNDVAIMVELYKDLLPYIPYHPARSSGLFACPACGEERLYRNGLYKAVTRTYQRYRCGACGHSCRAVKAEKLDADVVVSL